MAKLLKIGIVGCGAIGSSLARTIAGDFKKAARLAALYDIDPHKAATLSHMLSGGSRLAVKDLEGLILRSNLVIEAAHAHASYDIAARTLARGKDVMVMSVGGIVEHSRALERLARRTGTRVYIPSGAISGIDALKAANVGRVRAVTLTTRKHPLSFRGVKYIEQRAVNLAKIRTDTVLFSGSARRAMKLFPQNVNVAGILSLAGIGPEKTRVRIIASPRAKKNIHEIEIQAEAGTIFTRTENILHPENPKTSYLAVLSAVAALRQIVRPVRVGT
ncbi:MAG: aspartate dehydrogenase [Candidatus Omnitrophica bacterium]|nr:aspartate dehydrogenase [Candidatus Omnitrophota bacterium]